MSGSHFTGPTGDQHLARAAAARLVGHEARLCRPARRKQAPAAPTDRRFPLSAALVTDTGHVVRCRTFATDRDRCPRAGRAPEHPTDPRLTAVPLPHPVRFVHRATPGAPDDPPITLAAPPRWTSPRSSTSSEETGTR
ncbi:hypothetical protein ACIBTP_27595 [Streptomyces avidinii]|uniref:hypothetical protein n=1 Tax=Streptomyces avidinii TaxID=1895 RepID=UPI0037BD4280